MKFLRIASIALILFVTASACSKKSSTTPSSKSIEGAWVGKYGFDSEVPHVFYSFNIKANGILEELSETGTVKATGTWEIDNNIFTGKYTNVAPSTSKYSVIGAFNSSTGKILGNWGYSSSTTNGGTWEMTRKN